MAEGWGRALLGDIADVTSAGTAAHGLNPRAVRAMREAGVDISHHTSKTIDDLAGAPFDLVVTVCDHAHEVCPFYPGARVQMHHNFDDPPVLADGLPEDEAMRIYTRVCGEIKNFVAGLRPMITAQNT
jgi:arsenate reductase